MFIIGVPYSSRRYGRGKRYRVFAFAMDFFGCDGSGGWPAGLEAAQDGARAGRTTALKTRQRPRDALVSGTAVSAYLIKIAPITVLL